MDVDGKSYGIYRLDAVEGDGLDVASLPFSLKVLLENLLRTEDGANITEDDIKALAGWDADADPDKEIQFTPSRVIMQDFTGVPCVVDLATMREAMADLGGDPSRINPLAPAEMVIDHSVIADVFGTPEAFERNVEIEYERNKERYQFLRWGQGAFDDFKVVRPARASSTRSTSSTLRASCSPREIDGELTAYPTPLSAPTPTRRWSTASASSAGASAASRPRRRCSASRCSMLIPRVVGFKLNGDLPEGATATDLVLTITEMLREHGVVGKFVEFYGPGVSALPLANRATIGNMQPGVRLHHRGLPGRRGDHQVPQADRSRRRADRSGRGLRQGAGTLARPGCGAALLRAPRASTSPRWCPSLAGPKRPQDRVSLSDAKEAFRSAGRLRRRRGR